MMPLTMMNIGETNYIIKITGNDETRRFLERLGFIEGEAITVISELEGNMILSIKDTRIALDKSMINRIMV